MNTLITALIFLFGFLFWRIGKQIIRTYQHIDEDTMRAFWRNRLKDNEKRRVVTHLGHCEECRELFDRVRKGKPLEDHLVD